MKQLSTCLFFALALSACGSEDPSSSQGGSDGSRSTETLLPWTTGNRWVYKVTKDGEVSTKETTVGEAEPVGGSGPAADVTAFKVVTLKKNGKDKTVSWQAVEGDRVVRYREQSFSASTGELELEEHWDPHKIHIDSSEERTKEGASWLEEYEETKIRVNNGTVKTSTRRDRWTVLADNEELTVPAGTFKNVVVLQKVGGDTAKTYWYARGVGKLKEIGGQTEELVEYELAE